MADAQQVGADFVAAFNDHDESRIRELNAENAVLEAPGDVRVEGGEAATQYAMAWLNAFPDARLTVKNELAWGDWVAPAFTFEGTREGSLSGPAGDATEDVARDDQDDLRPPDRGGRDDPLADRVLAEAGRVPAVAEGVDEDADRRLPRHEQVVEVVRGEVHGGDRDERRRVAAGGLGDAALAEERADEQEGEDERGDDRHHEAGAEQVVVPREERRVVEEPALESGEAVRLRPAVVDDGRERREHEGAAAARKRGVAPQAGAEPAQADGSLLRRRREPVVRVRRRELGGREAGEGAGEDGEELDVAEPCLGAVDGGPEQRRDAVDERGGRDR